MSTRAPIAEEELVVHMPTTATADQLALASEIRAMWQRVLQRQLWSRGAVRELLLGAADAGGKDVDKGRALLERAQEMFDDDVQTKNRMFYVIGVVLGVGVVALVTAGVVLFARAFESLTKYLADPSFVIALFAFAGMGSLTSVLIRLSTIDLKHELRQKFVVLSAAARPIVAMAFASIAYVVLKNGLISVRVGAGGADAQDALIWTAAFLCGFSERFATDLLERVTFFARRSSDAPGADARTRDSVRNG